MDFNSQWLFFFSALGAFNGLLLSFYFLVFARPRHKSNYFLGGLLLMLSIRIGKSVIFHFNPDLSYDFLQFGLSACIFIGPFLFFYLAAITHPNHSILNYWKVHFGVLLVLTLGVGIRYPFEHYEHLWRPCFIKSIYLIWLAYIIASGFLMIDTFKRFLQKKEKLHSIEIWTLSVFIGIAVIWMAYFFVGFFSYILGALLFSFVLYLLILLLIFNKKKDHILFKATPKYAAKKIANTEAIELTKQLETIMLEEELFKNPQLKLPDVAQQLGILPHRLSQLLNDNLGKSFPSYINEFRVAAACQMLASHNQFTLEAIGYECGFKSKSTFFTVFKKIKGKTPAQYKKSVDS